MTDGDSLKVQLSSGPITVRLGQIDAPESDQPCGQKAAAALRTLAGGRTVELEVFESQDRYERLVAVVYTAGTNVNEALDRGGDA